MRKFLFLFSFLSIHASFVRVMAQCLQPIVLTEINGTQQQNVNDGVTDVVALSICGNVQNNIQITTAFTATAGGPQTRLFQFIQTNNATMGPWCNNCQALVSAFVPPNFATAAIVNPLIPGSVTVSWVPWVDTDNDGIIDVGECVGDTIRWIFNLMDDERPDIVCAPDITIDLQSDITCDTFLYLLPTYSDPFCSSVSLGLVNELAPSNWVTSNTGQGTPAFNFFAPDSLRIRGSAGGTSGGTSANGSALMCHTFVCSGRFSFTYNIRKTGPGVFGPDQAFYVLNGNSTNLTPNAFTTTASGSVSIDVNAGDLFCFNVLSNNAGSHTVLVAHNFSFRNFTITQTMGPLSNSAPGVNDGQPFPAGVHTVQFVGRDCGGNTDTCSTTVTVTDTPPSITCPDDITILLDTFDCTRVFCYNVVAEDNCPNTNLNIPGYQFIGVYNGNSYYISPPGVANHVHWLDANRIAAELGGHLATIEDANENLFLLNNIPFTNPFINGIGSNQYWIGLRYSPMLDQFKWTTEEPFVYSNWGPGQPGIIPGQYVWFLDLSLTGTWWDSPSLLFRRYIIEFENGLRTRMLSGIASGGVFPPGVTTNVYEVEDAFGQTASCSFTVNVIGSTQLSCKPINVSLDEDCSALITPEMLLTGPYNCYDVFEVSLSHYNHPVPNPLTKDWLGKTIKAEVSDPTTGNKCWSEILVEDKLAPTILCRNDTVSCIEFMNMQAPAASEDCSDYTVQLLDELIQPLRCDPEFVKKVTRRYVSVDSKGNVSDTCTQVLCVERAPLSDIVYPLDVELSCDAVYYDSLGGVHPDLTGVPMLGGVGIYPWRDFLCNVYVDYEDLDLGEINCVRKIMRSWRIREWWCSDEFVYMNIPPQLITIVDRQGPVIGIRPHDFQVSTGPRSCKARVAIPPIQGRDACHGIFRIDVAYPGGSLVGQNGGVVDLGVGDNEIVYRVYDSCYNVSTDTLIIRVVDGTAPVAVCDRRTVTALNHWGEVWMPAEVLDDGSFDECKLKSYEVRRLDRDHCGSLGEDDWGAEVQFCCEDVGRQIMVALKVEDHSGNAATCMVTVEVQDKEGPSIVCPPNVTVECRYDIDLTNLDEFGEIRMFESERAPIVIDSSYYHEFDTPHPRDGLATDNCPPVISESIDLSGMDQCGNGIIVRIFTATDQQGSTASCVQTIRITSLGVFTEADIDWPEDFDTSGICDSRLLLPEVLRDAEIKQPRYSDDECSLIGLSYTDQILSTTLPGEPCFKILRRWKVIDWCYRDGDNLPVIYEYEQVIKVYNEDAPEIDRTRSDCRDTVICSYSDRCAPIPVRFRASARDECTADSELLWRYKIDFHRDGTTDVNAAGVNGNVASGTWPIGVHKFKWEVEDRCGNVDVCEFTVELRNCKAPTAYCLYGLSTSVTPMDTTGDGVADTEMTTIWAKDFDAGSYHVCGYPLRISFSRDVNDTVKVLDCDDVGMRVPIEMWVTDIHGNTSYCTTFINVQDSNGVDICRPTARRVTINGLVATQWGARVEQVELALEQSGMASVQTNYDGEYRFGEMAAGGSYVLRARKEDDWLNGVTTSDILRIQRHILGVDQFRTAYEMIAADVNNSRSITARDMADLRKLILGVDRRVEGNTSWRFVDAAYRFGSVDSCLERGFAEYSEIRQLRDNTVVNFTAIKVGDLNGSAKTRGVQGGLQVRQGSAMKLVSEDQYVERERVYAVDVRGGDNAEGYAGVQFTLSFAAADVEVLEVIGSEQARFGQGNYTMKYIGEGQLPVSWDGELKADGKLFTLIIKAKRNGYVSDLLRLSDAVTPVLAVERGTQEETGVVWQIGRQRIEGGIDDFAVYPSQPNPMRERGVIQLGLPDEGVVTLSIYDARGKVYYRSQRAMKKGLQAWEVDRDILPTAGLYFYQVDWHDRSVTRRLVVLD